MPQSAVLSVNDGRTVGPSRLAASGESDRLYVGNTGNNSITVYWHAASGNAAPLFVIEGAKTGISNPGQLSSDAQGNLYVANGSYQGTSSNPGILVFAHGANGNVAPIRKIAGPLTGIHNVQAMTVDKVTGDLFVADNEGVSGVSSTLMVVPPNASGNVAPLAREEVRHPAAAGVDSTGATIAYWAIQFASDSTGRNLIAAHFFACCNAASGGVETYSKSFQNDADLVPIYAFNAFRPNGVADDPTTRTYLTSSAAGLYRVAEDTTGYGAHGNVPANFKPAVVSIIANETCGTQLAVAPGPTPYTYVIHGTQAGCPSNAVYVYANDASGNAVPLRILSGPATKMSLPYGIYEGY